MNNKHSLPRFILGLVLAIALASASLTAYADTIPPEQKKCQQDQDCAFIALNCSSCCPDLDNSDAVNNAYAQLYEKLGVCSREHIQSCGVPECGLFSPMPVAVCLAGSCHVVMRGRPGDPVTSH